MARYPGFIFGSDPSQSALADGSRTVNWYPEQVPAPGAPYQLVLYPTPGWETYTTSDYVGTRALYTVDGRCFAVMGEALYEVFSGGGLSLLNSATPLATDDVQAQMVWNGATAHQLAIASGGSLYVLDTTSLTLSGPIYCTDATTPVVANMVAMIDGYTLALDQATSSFRWSTLSTAPPYSDATDWDAANFAVRSIAPDPWRAMVVDGKRLIWLIGEQTGEVWYDAQVDVNTPFAPVPGAVFRYGTVAPWSVCTGADSVFWLSQNAGGNGIVVMTQGYTPQRISTNAVETAIANYQRTSTIADAEGYTYQDQGHVFYVLSFPSAGATWVYDMTTGLWHERGSWDTAAEEYTVWHPRVHTFAFGRHIVGDRDTANLYNMDVTLTAEGDGALIRRLRRPPPLTCADRMQRMIVSRFELLLEPGLGLGSGQGSDPQVMYRSSTDSKTWNPIRQSGAGVMGDYEKRVVWFGCGSSLNQWVPEITVSDPIPWRLLGADVKGNNINGVTDNAS